MNITTMRSETITRSNRSRRMPQARGGRFASAIEIVTIAVLMVAVVVAVLTAGTGTGLIETTVSIRVEPGDTLWEIAATHPVPGVDTRESVEAISALNDLDGSDLRIGQVLKVPVQTTPDFALASR